MHKLIDIVEQALRDARLLLQRTERGDEIVHHGGAFGDLARDTELRGDRVLGEHIRDTFADIPGVERITVEGMGDAHSPSGTGTLWVTGDPIDGSLNYKRGQHVGLPYVACITVLQRCINAALSDVIAAGVIDLRGGNLWLAEKQGERYTTTFNGAPISCATEQALDIGSMIVFGEIFYPEGRGLLARAFAGESGWLRSYGSSAYEMAVVAAGGAAAFISTRQKFHELGAGYALVRGAGGVALDFYGSDIGSLPYDFNSQTPCILAANESIAAEIVARIKAVQ